VHRMKFTGSGYVLNSTMPHTHGRSLGVPLSNASEGARLGDGGQRARPLHLDRHLLPRLPHPRPVHLGAARPPPLGACERLRWGLAQAPQGGSAWNVQGLHWDAASIRHSKHPGQRGSGRMEPAPPGARPLLPCRSVAEQCSADRPKPCDPARPAHLRERGGRDRALPKLGEHRVQRPPQLGLQHAPRLGRPAACTHTLQGRRTAASPDRRPASHTVTGRACERGGSMQVRASRGGHRKGGMPSCSLASSAITGGGSTSGRMDSTCARRAPVAAKAVTADRLRHAPPHLLLSGSGLVQVQTRNQVSSAGGDREGQGGLHGTHACCAGWDTQTAGARPASRQGAASLAAPSTARRRAHAERGGAAGRRAPGPA